jgi:hypothetical protein
MRLIRATPLVSLLLVGIVLVCAAGAGDKADNRTSRPNLLIIGLSSLISPRGQPQLVDAMLESKGIPMNVEGLWYDPDAVKKALSSGKVWDYVVMDAWQFGRGRIDSQGLSKPVAAFVKQVRAHSPKCKIILFPWWIPNGPKATNEGVMEVFHRCVEEAKANDIWVATAGPAFMEARLARPDLRITLSKSDAHPGLHGAYLNACSLFTIITGRSPVGLPATLKITGSGGKRVDYTIEPGDAKYLQELAWKVYQRERTNTKPAK